MRLISFGRTGGRRHRRSSSGLWQLCAAPQDRTSYCYYWCHQWSFEFSINCYECRLTEGQSEGGVWSIDLSFHDLKFSFFLKSKIFYLEILSRSELFYSETLFVCQIWKVKGHRYLTVLSILEYLNGCFFKFGTWGSKINSFGGQKAKVRVLLHFFSTICWKKQPLFFFLKISTLGLNDPEVRGQTR